MELILHAYSREALGLVCVAGISDNDISPSVWNQVIKPGLTNVGVAFRRGEIVSWVAKPGRENEGTELFDYGQGHSAILSIPLLYPARTGARIAILSLASKSPTSNLINLDIKTAAFNILIDYIVINFNRLLISALNLE